MTDQFTEFWSVYPRRIAKLAARKAYDKALRITTHERIMAAVRQYARIYSVPAQGFRPDPKHPTTWLNGGCWEDYAVVAKPNGDAPVGVFVKQDTPQWEQWQSYCRARDGVGTPCNRDFGWYFPSEWPPGATA